MAIWQKSRGMMRKVIGSSEESWGLKPQRREGQLCIVKRHFLSWVGRRALWTRQFNEGDPYDFKVKMIAPKTFISQGQKTYYGGGEWYHSPISITKAIRGKILYDAGLHGARFLAGIRKAKRKEDPNYRRSKKHQLCSDRGIRLRSHPSFPPFLPFSTFQKSDSLHTQGGNYKDERGRGKRKEKISSRT